jgi:muramidase (phage lysozyme)
LLLIPISAFAELQRRNAVMQRQIAEEQRQIAEEQRQIADDRSKEAQRQRDISNNQRILVEELFLGGSSKVQKQDTSLEVKAFLDTVAWSLGRLPENGYRLMIDGKEFNDFSDHPRERLCGAFYDYGRTTLCADSAGRYHIISSTWDPLVERLGLDDFSPKSQDEAAIELMREHGALKELESGNFDAAIYRVSDIWVTLPEGDGTSPNAGHTTYSIEQLRFMYSIFYARYK